MYHVCSVYYLGAQFLTQPSRYNVIKTGSIATFEWIYQDPDRMIRNAQIFSHIGGRETLLFRTTPDENSSNPFGDDEIKKRVKITLPVPLQLTVVSARMLISNVTTADTGFYSFEVNGISNPGNLSNVSLYVTGMC